MANKMRLSAANYEELVRITLADAERGLGTGGPVEYLVDLAQVYATLAQAAAIAEMLEYQNSE